MKQAIKRTVEAPVGEEYAVPLPNPARGHRWQGVRTTDFSVEIAQRRISADPKETAPFAIVRGHVPGSKYAVLKSVYDLAPTVPDAKVRLDMMFYRPASDVTPA